MTTKEIKSRMKEKREQTIQCLTDMLRATAFQVEYKVMKKPKGIKVIIGVTQEQMEALTKQMIDKFKEED